MKDIEVERLLFDPYNPRLPEDIRGGPQEDIFDYLYNSAAPEELIDSMLENGYFEHEPLIIIEPNRPEDLAYDQYEDGLYFVVEGNRRLAALSIIHDLPAAQGMSSIKEPTPEQKSRLERVTCYLADDREEVRRYLGFRHIGGLKPWRPEAKARYLTQEVDRAHQEGKDDPFLYVAERVGSNKQGVRNSYLSFSTLRYAREEYSIKVGYILSERFGVWRRCITSSDIKKYIGLNSPKGYSEVNDQLDHIEEESLREVIGDLTPQDSGTPLLSDSRDVTQYGDILQDDHAHRILRETEDLSVAKEAIRGKTLANKVSRVVTRAQNIRKQVNDLDEADEDLVESLEELKQVAVTTHAAAKALQA